MFHNDYINAVREYLTRYYEFNTYIKNLKADLEDLNAMQALCAAPKVPTLSHTPGGNGIMISPEERAIYEKENLESRRKKLQSDLEKIEPLMRRLDRSIETLSYSDRIIAEERFIDGASWIRIADTLHMSETAVRKRSGKVLEQIAAMMFGPAAIPVQTHFVFFDELKNS